ncbi:hypothetical protein [Hymenobacter radiodurans]|uniref:hypothetical protein n=1 Tax=Hymenobacter radiodurans TaxID=2496028 RepID=UPI00105918A6|nr:hypothetical protein [Hymenobacter radiodurans]
MHFHERLYQLHIILGNPQAPALWEPKCWHAIQDSLLRATKAARGSASLNSLQYEPNGQYMKDVKFGRLGLSAISEARWLHDYTAYPERQGWLFHSLELWAPGRTTCNNQNLAPDMYLGVMNEGYYANLSNILYNPYIVLAGALDKEESFLASINQLATTLAQQTQAVFTHNKVIPWGNSSGSNGFSKAIGDLLSSSIFLPSKHTASPFLDRIEEYWK